MIITNVLKSVDCWLSVALSLGKLRKESYHINLVGTQWLRPTLLWCTTSSKASHICVKNLWLYDSTDPNAYYRSEKWKKKRWPMPNLVHMFRWPTKMSHLNICQIWAHSFSQRKAFVWGPVEPIEELSHNFFDIQYILRIR